MRYPPPGGRQHHGPAGNRADVREGADPRRHRQRRHSRRWSGWRRCTPDIVLAGTTLPQVSGYDLAKHMRSQPGLRNVPVLLLTGAFETVDEERLKASGANGVLEKPVEPTDVIARVKELLGLKSEAKPATAGRLVTSAGRPGGRTNCRRPTVRARSPPRSARPRSRQQPRDQHGRRGRRGSVEDRRRARTTISTRSMPPSTHSISNCPDASGPRSRRAIRPARSGSRPGRPIRVRQAAVRR